MYTKGEWKYTRPQIGTPNGVICTMIEPHFMPDCGDRTWYNGHVETMKANAHLIAAAPAMYEALQKVCKWLDMVARDADTKAALSNFITLIVACKSDAANYRATAKDLRLALAKAEGKE